MDGLFQNWPLLDLVSFEISDSKCVFKAFIQEFFATIRNEFFVPFQFTALNIVL